MDKHLKRVKSRPTIVLCHSFKQGKEIAKKIGLEDWLPVFPGSGAPKPRMAGALIVAGQKQSHKPPELEMSELLALRHCFDHRTTEAAQVAFNWLTWKMGQLGKMAEV